MNLILALLIILISIFLIVKKIDVRFVLIASGLLLGLINGTPSIILDTFLKTMGDGKIIGPICSAMGFAFVLKETGSDQEMVKLLLRPFLKFRWALVPAGILAGLFTNMAITSQTAAAAAIGPVLIPLLLATGYSPLIAGVVLIVGCSGGGNLFNPGEPDVVAVMQATNAPAAEVLNATILPFTIAFLIPFIYVCYLAYKDKSVEQESELISLRPNIMKAILPPLPVLILLILRPQYNFIPILTELYPEGLPISHVMLCCTLLTMFVTRSSPNKIFPAFFQGLGHAYVHVISLIIAASCFIKGLEMVGMIATFVGIISNSGAFAKILSLLPTTSLAVLSGSGTAPSVSFSKAILPSLAQTDLKTAIDLGVIGSIGASFGRSMSPVAAVVMYVSTLVEVPPMTLIKKTSVGLILGLCLLSLFLLVF